MLQSENEIYNFDNCVNQTLNALLLLNNKYIMIFLLELKFLNKATNMLVQNRV